MCKHRLHNLCNKKEEPVQTPQRYVISKVALVFQRVQIMIVLINKSILQIKLATQEKMICLEKSKR